MLFKFDFSKVSAKRLLVIVIAIAMVFSQSMVFGYADETGSQDPAAGTEGSVSGNAGEDPTEPVVTGIEYYLAEPYEVLEEKNGDWFKDEDGNDYFHYNLPSVMAEGDILKLITENGELVYTYGTKGEEDGYLDEDGNIAVSTNDVEYYDRQDTEHWTVGDDNFIYVKYISGNEEFWYNVPVTVTENPDATGVPPENEGSTSGNAGSTSGNAGSATGNAEEVIDVYFVFKGGLNYTENDNGEYKNDEDGQYFYYNEPNLFEDGNRLEVNNKWYVYHSDGFKDSTKPGFYRYTGRYISPDDVELNTNQETKHWTPGNDNFLTVTYKGVSGKIRVNILGTVNSIEFRPEEGISLIEELGGYKSYEYGTGPDGEEIVTDEYYFYSYVDEINKSGNSIIVNGSDTFTFDNDDYNFINEKGERLREKYGDFDYSDTQNQNHWTLEGPNSFELTLGGHSCTVPVKILPNPVNTVEYIPAKPITVYEETNGNWTHGEKVDVETGETQEYDFYHYDTEDLYNKDGDILKINGDEDYIYKLKDGRYDYYNTVTEESLSDKYSGQYPYLYSDQYNTPWELGENTATIEFMNRECPVTVTVTENPVDTIEYTLAEPITLYQNIGGDWYEDDNGSWFRYEYNYYQDGAVLTVNYKDGHSESFTCKTTDGDDPIFIDESGNTAFTAGAIRTETDQWEDHFGLGTQIITITYLGKSCDFSINIVENPVEKFTVSMDEPITYFQNTNGWLEDDHIYIYDYSRDLVERDGSVFHVSYKDGREVDYSYSYNENDGIFGFYDEDGNKLSGDYSVDADQEQKPWTTYSKNWLTVKYMGLETKVPVVIKENNVESFSFKPGKNVVLRENIDVVWDYDENDNKIPRYIWQDLIHDENNILTVDGTEYTFQEVQIENWYEPRYADENGNILEYPEPVFTDNQEEEPWTVGGNNIITVTFMGMTQEIPVTILPSDYRTLEFQPAEEVTIYENAEGELKNEGTAEEYFEYDLPEIYKPGSKFIINKGEDDEEVLTAKEDPDNDEWVYFYDSEGNVANRWETPDCPRTIETYADQETTHWTKGGNNLITISYLGLECTVPVTILDNPVESIAFESAEPIQLVEGVDVSKDTIRDYETGTDKEVILYNFDKEDLYADGNKIIVNDKHEYVADETEKAFFDSNGNNLEELGELIYSDDQYDNQWTVGNNHFTLTLLGKSCEGTVKIIENPVESISFTTAEPLVRYEGEGVTETDEDGNEFIYYNDDFYDELHKEGNVLTVNKTNGDTEKYTYGRYAGPNGYYYDFINDETKQPIDYPDGISYDTNQYENHWAKDKTNYLDLTFMGKTCQVEVAIVESPVKSVTLNTSAKFDLYEGYDLSDLILEFNEGDTLTVETASEPKVYTYGNHIRKDESGCNVIIMDFFNGDEYIDNNEIRFVQGQTTEGWTAPGEYQVNYSYKGCTFPVTVNYIENTVTDIEYSFADNRIFENVDGVWRIDDKGNKFFYYNGPKGGAEGNTLTVTYKDGKKTVYTCHNNDYYDEDGNSLAPSYSSLDNQYEEHWTVGTNYLEIEYMGCTCKAEVIVQENLVESVEYIPANDHLVAYKKLTRSVSNVYVPYFNNGDVIRVTYKDGTSEDFTYKYSSDGVVQKHFVDESGKAIDLDTYGIDISVPDVDNLQIGESEMTLTAFGQEVSVPLTVAENTVSKVSVNMNHTVKAEDFDYDKFVADDGTEYVSCYWMGRTGGINDLQPYAIFKTGDTITVTYSDETEDVYTFNEDKDFYGFFDSKGNELSSMFIEFSDNGANSWNNISNDNKYWTKGGNNEIYVKVLGYQADPIKVLVGDSECEHVWNEGEVTTAATCGADGVKTFTCTLCGETKTEVIPKTGEHKWNNGEVTKEATCGADGEKTYTCTVCGETNTEAIPKTTEHTWNAGEVTKEATCKEEGIKTYTCTVCGETKTDAIPKTTEHTWNEGEVTTPASCKDGVKTYTCTVCGETRTEAIPATGEHAWDNGKVTTAATCQTEGVKTFTCTACGEEKTETIPVDPDAHKETVIPGKAATCTETGLTDGKECALCGKVLAEQEEIPLKAHTFKTTTTKATLTANGSIVSKCTACGHVNSTTTIYHPRTIALTATNYAYDGRAKTPGVRVVDAAGKTIAASNYTVSYAAGRSAIGTYAVTVTMKGNYTGSKSLSFMVTPKGTSVKSAKGAKKALTVKWVRQSSKMPKTRIAGYQVQIATNAAFTQGVKTVNVKGYKKTSRKIKGLQRKVVYYARVRTYIKVGGRTYYSNWSAVKSGKTK